VDDELNPEYADGYCAGDEALVLSFDFDLPKTGVAVEID
jgi:hypothetical protein